MSITIFLRKLPQSSDFYSTVVVCAEPLRYPTWTYIMLSVRKIRKEVPVYYKNFLQIWSGIVLTKYSM